MKIKFFYYFFFGRYYFSQSFFQINNRKPTDTEIIDNLQDEIPIDILQNIIENQKLDIV